MAQPKATPESIRAGKNTTGSTIAKALFVKLTSGGLQNIALPAATTDAVYGLTMAAIANNTHGDVQLRGIGVATAGGSVTAGTRLMAGTTGKLVTWTAAGGNAVAAIALEDASTDELFEVELVGPGIYGIS